MNGQFKRCKRCGAIYQNRSGSYCEKCFKEMDEKYVLIRDYLYDNPNATPKEVMDETGVEESIILLFLKEGRLQMKSAEGLIRCEKCGKPITHGNLCDNCRNAMSKLLDKGLEMAARNNPAASHGKKSEASAPNGGYKSSLLKK